MKTRFFSLLLLTAIVLAGLVSATITANFDSDFTKKDNAIVLTVNSDIAETVNLTGIPTTITDGTNILSVSANPTSLVFAAAGTKTINFSYSVSSGSLEDFALGTFSKIITLTGNTSGAINKTLNFVSEFCDEGCIGENTIDGKDYKLEMSIDDIKVEGFGPEDNEWYPLDNIEIELLLENKDDEDISDIMIEVCLYDEIEQKCIVDEGDMNLDDDFKIKDGDDKTVIITYNVDPDDIDNVGDYVLYIKAYSDKLGEENLAVQDSADITIIDDEFVLLDKDTVEIPETASCGDTIGVTADVWNIGTDEQDDVTLGVANKELGINKIVEVGSINNWDKEEVSFDFQIPENADEKVYTIKLSVYDEDEDVFETDQDEEESVSNYIVKVENCVKPVTKDASISAILETEEIKAGKEVVIRATVTNTGDEKTTYSIGVEGYEFFSVVQSINPSTVTLDPGKDQDVLITLKLNNDAAGEQVFNIKTLFDTEEVKQPVSLSIPESGGVSITGSAIGESIKQNWFIWVIVLINIILIIAIIIVAARMSKA